MCPTATAPGATAATTRRKNRDVPTPDGFEMLPYFSGLGAQLAGAANVIMQLSWPEVGYGVMNSRVHDGAIMQHPIKRTRTTFTYLAVALLGLDEDRTAYRRAVNGQHAQVVSREDEPVHYRAMDPRLQTWVAACLYYGTRDIQQKFHGPMDPATADALYAHCAKFGTTLQMPPEAWPADRSAFDEYWEESAAEIRIDPEVRDYLMRLLELRFLPRPLRLLAPVNVFVSTGFLPPRWREEMQLSWTPAQQRRFDRLMKWCGRLDRAMPTAVRAQPFPLLLRDMRRRRERGKPLL